MKPVIQIQSNQVLLIALYDDDEWPSEKGAEWLVKEKSIDYFFLLLFFFNRMLNRKNYAHKHRRHYTIKRPFYSFG